MSFSYDNKTFRSVENSAHGEVGPGTVFRYHQNDLFVWAEYYGGDVVFGTLIAKVLADDSLDMRYQHLNKEGHLMTGVCTSTPERLADGRIRLHEKWRWTCGDRSSGESVVEEISEKEPA